MRTLLLASALAVAGFAIAAPISVAPASAQIAVDTPIGGMRVVHREALRHICRCSSPDTSSGRRT